jgi:hypothetical protein
MTEQQRVAEEFTVYGYGLVYASVCTTLPAAQVADRMDATCPTGISSRWQLSADERFASGQPNPCPCERNPATHTHYLLEC